VQSKNIYSPAFPVTVEKDGKICYTEKNIFRRNNMSRLRLMSNNQWKNDRNHTKWEERGLDCSAAVREAGFAEVYALTAPDVVGLQEVSPLMIDELMGNLQRMGLPYALLWGRDTPVLYRTDKMELVDSWHSLYPDECPGFDGIFNNSRTKSFTIAVFRTKEDGALFLFTTTHLWWKSSDPASGYYQHGSDEARAYQIGLVIEKIGEFQKKYGCPAVIVGDFNADCDSLAMKYALNHGFLDAHDIAVDYAEDTNGWHPCGNDGFAPYQPREFRHSIDHIMVRNAPDGFVKRFDRYIADSYLPLSDHFPLWIDVEF